MASLTLFPPIVETYPPVFVDENNIKIYFEKPAFNTDDSGYVHVALSLVSNGASYLAGQKDFLRRQYQQDSKGKYYVTLTQSDLHSTLALNNYYKVQLRLEESDIPIYEDKDAWYDNNKDKFSEWSVASFIRRISTPELKGYEFEYTKITGLLGFENATETESFKWCQVQIKKETEIIETSPILNFSSFQTSAFEYLPKTEFESGVYNLIIYYETLNGYKGSCVVTNAKEFTVTVNNYVSGEINPVSAYVQTEFGCITLLLYNIGGFATIRRADSSKNFSLWQKVIEYTLDAGQTYYWQDLTVESGIFYQYEIIIENENAVTLYKSNQTLINLDSIFLTDKDNVFTVTFDPKVSSLKYVTAENITNTLGSKYPFVRRNAATKYRTFTLGGLISFYGDQGENSLYWEDSLGERGENNTGIEISEDGYELITYYKNPLFIKENSIFQENRELYDNYLYQKNIQSHEDIIFERFFRDLVIEFLTNGKPKLFRSATEGNMLIYLSNVSFTPKDQLGRRIYSFSATATEIAEVNYDNYYKYQILDKDNMNNSLVSLVIQSGYGITPIAAAAEKDDTPILYAKVE